MEYLNRAELVGSVGRIAISKIGDTKVASIALATERGYKDEDGNWIRETTWFNVTAFQNNDMPDLESIKPYSVIRVKGQIRIARFTDCYGAERSVIEINCRSIETVADTNKDMQPENCLEEKR